MVGAVQGPEMELIFGQRWQRGRADSVFPRSLWLGQRSTAWERAEITELLNDVERAGRVRVNWNLKRSLFRAIRSNWPFWH